MLHYPSIYLALLLHTLAFAAATMQLICWWDIRSQEVGVLWSEGIGMANRQQGNILLALDLRILFVFSASVKKMGSQEWCYNFLWIINDSLKKSRKWIPGLNQVCFDFSFPVFVLFFYMFKFRCILVQTVITPSLCCPSWLITSVSQPQKTHCLLEVGTGPEGCHPPYCALKPWSCSSF